MEHNTDKKPWGMELNTFLMLLHLSQLAGYMIPGAGLLLPIVMWATNRDDFVEVDQHGKKVINWLISAFIYGFVSAILIVIGIGILMIVALAICNLIFAIMGAVKANDGVLWDYPLSIKFFK